MVENTFNSPAYVREEIKGEEYDKEEITIKRNGKETNLYQFIQDAREDTEIYPTLEKYGSIKPMEFNTANVYGDLGNIKNLRDLKEAEQASIELWNSLPLEIRNEFGNNRYDFIANGEKWLKNRIKAEQETEKTKYAEPAKQEEVNNG